MVGGIRGGSVETREDLSHDRPLCGKRELVRFDLDAVIRYTKRLARHRYKKQGL